MKTYMRWLISVVTLVVVILTFGFYIYPTQWAYYENGARRLNRFTGCSESYDFIGGQWSYSGKDEKCISNAERSRRLIIDAQIDKDNKREEERKVLYNKSKLQYINQVSAKAIIADRYFSKKFIVELYNPKECSITSMTIYINLNGKVMRYDSANRNNEDIPGSSKGEFIYELYDLEGLESSEYTWGIENIEYRGDSNKKYDIDCLNK